MGRWRKLSIFFAILVLVASIAFSLYLLFSNYQNVRLLHNAEQGLRRNDPASLQIAEDQLKQLINNDGDNEQAYLLLAHIAEQRKHYPELVNYCYHAYKLNPLSEENKKLYITSLLRTRDFPRLENFLALERNNNVTQQELLLYAAANNRNLRQYEELLSQLEDSAKYSSLHKLIKILYLDAESNYNQKWQALTELQKDVPIEDFFLAQEIAAAKAKLALDQQKFKKAEIALQEAERINSFAFAPALGRFYANYRSFGQALTVFEKYLDTYHDPLVGLQTAEIYCLLKKTDKILELRRKYQEDSGTAGLLCSYYFDALSAFAGSRIPETKRFLAPVRQMIATPLAIFMCLCVEVEDRNFVGVEHYYDMLLNHRSYLDLQKRADQMVLDMLRKSIRESVNPREKEQLFSLAEKLYTRESNAFVMKYILLFRHQRGILDINLLHRALKCFPDDSGIQKIAIEYYLQHDPREAEKIIIAFERQFPKQAAEMLRYKIFSAMRNNRANEASTLFQKNLSPELCPAYWDFAISTGRLEDLRYLSKEALYQPFCKAAILLLEGRKAEALDLLIEADAAGNLSLLFYAARTLGENGRTNAALAKYALFPANSSYQRIILMNCAELQAENGNLTEALHLAQTAYNQEPSLPETQYCYAEKLYRIGRFEEIVDVANPAGKTSIFSEKLKKLWIVGMEHRVTRAAEEQQSNELGKLCDRLLRIDPHNKLGLKYQQCDDSWRVTLPAAIQPSNTKQ